MLTYSASWFMTQSRNPKLIFDFERFVIWGKIKILGIPSFQLVLVATGSNQ